MTVTLRSSKILPKEDPDAAEIIYETLKKDGINFETGVRYDKVTYEAGAGQSIGPGGDVFPEISLHVTQNGVQTVLKVRGGRWTTWSTSTRSILPSPPPPP